MRRAIPLALLVFSIIMTAKLVAIAHAETNTTGTSTCDVCDKCPISKILHGENPGWDFYRLDYCFECLACTISEAFNSLFNAITSLLTSIKNAIVTATNAVWEAITYPFRMLYNGLMSLGSAIKNAIISFVNGVHSVFSTIAGAVGYAGSSVKDAIIGAVEWVKQNVWVLFLAAAGIIAIRYAIMG